MWCLCLRKIRSAQRLVLAAAYALLAVTLASIFLPCIGPWYAGGFTPLPSQQACAQTLVSLRSGTGLLSGQDARIICFPSFHVCLAFLTAFALRSLSRTLGAIAILWATVVATSTILLGWHYAADVLGGVLLALLCFRLAAASDLPLDSKLPSWEATAVGVDGSSP